MGKLIRAVLRGLEGGNALRLLDLGGSNVLRLPDWESSAAKPTPRN
jgi:hypothetical protein